MLRNVTCALRPLRHVEPEIILAAPMQKIIHFNDGLFCKIMSIHFVRDNYLRELGPVAHVSANSEPLFTRSGTRHALTFNFDYLLRCYFDVLY